MNYMYSLFCIERFVVLHVGREKVFFLIFAIFSAILVSMMVHIKK